jgi:hypothetical protein
MAGKDYHIGEKYNFKHALITPAPQKKPGHDCQQAADKHHHLTDHFREQKFADQEDNGCGCYHNKNPECNTTGEVGRLGHLDELFGYEIREFGFLKIKP